MVAVVASERRGEVEHPLADLQVVADEVVLASETTSARDREHVPVEGLTMDGRRIEAPAEPIEVDRHVPPVEMVDGPSRAPVEDELADVAIRRSRVDGDGQ